MAARFLQGLGGGAITVTLYVLVRADLRARSTTRAIFGAFAAVLGDPVDGRDRPSPGVVAETVGWRWVFLGVVGLAAARDGDAAPGTARRGRPSRAVTGRVGPASAPGHGARGRRSSRSTWPGGSTGRRRTSRPLSRSSWSSSRRAHCCRPARCGRPAACRRSSGCAASSRRRSSRPRSTCPYLLQEQYDLAVWLSGAALTVGALGWASASQVQARLGARLTNATVAAERARCCSSRASGWCSRAPSWS